MYLAKNKKYIKPKYSKNTQVDYNKLHNTTYVELNG